MTHDDITNRLRDPRPTMSIDAQTLMIDAADRLDRYREALEVAKANMDVFNAAMSDRQCRLETSYIDEALK